MKVGHLKGLLLIALIKALFKSKEIKDKEQFISDFDELLDCIKEVE